MSAPPTHDVAERDELRARLEETLEDVAFLREQLRASEAWSARLVDTLRAEHRALQQAVIRDLAVVIEGLQRHPRADDTIAEGPPTSVPDRVAPAQAERTESGR